MQQCLRTDGVVKISKGLRAVPEIEVADKESCRKQRLSESGHLSRIEEDRAGNHTEKQNREEGWEDATHSSLIERNEREFAFSQFPCQYRGDEIPRDDIEDIDTDESASKRRKPRVKKSTPSTATARSPSTSGRYLAERLAIDS